MANKKMTGPSLPANHPAIAFLGLKKPVPVSASPDLYLDETWEGGSRTLTSIHKLGGATVHVTRARWPHPPTRYTLQPGEIAVETGAFRGKTLAPRVRMHPTDFDRLVLCCQAHEDCLASPELGRACLATTNTNI